MTQAAYEDSALVTAAVERKFEIIGEALSRLRRSHPDLFARIADGRDAIDFRNRLAHGYERIDPGVVWAAIIQSAPALRASAAALLVELG